MVSPSSVRHLAARSMACWAPVVMMIPSPAWESPGSRLLANCLAASRSWGYPSVTEYWRAVTALFSKTIRAMFSSCFTGKASGEGLPPAKGTMEGSAMFLKISRMAEGCIAAIRWEIFSSIKTPALLESFGGKGRRPKTGPRSLYQVIISNFVRIGKRVGILFILEKSCRFGKDFSFTNPIRQKGRGSVLFDLAFTVYFVFSSFWMAAFIRRTASSLPRMAHSSMPPPGVNCLPLTRRG